MAELTLFTESGKEIVYRTYDCGKCVNKTEDGLCQPITDGEETVLFSAWDGHLTACRFYEPKGENNG